MKSSLMCISLIIVIMIFPKKEEGRLFLSSPDKKTVKWVIKKVRPSGSLHRFSRRKEVADIPSEHPIHYSKTTPTSGGSDIKKIFHFPYSVTNENISDLAKFSPVTYIENHLHVLVLITKALPEINLYNSPYFSPNPTSSLAFETKTESVRNKRSIIKNIPRKRTTRKRRTYPSTKMSKPKTTTEIETRRPATKQTTLSSRETYPTQSTVKLTQASTTLLPGKIYYYLFFYYFILFIYLFIIYPTTTTQKLTPVILETKSRTTTSTYSTQTPSTRFFSKTYPSIETRKLPPITIHPATTSHITTTTQSTTRNKLTSLTTSISAGWIFVVPYAERKNSKGVNVTPEQQKSQTMRIPSRRKSVTSVYENVLPMQ